MAEHVAAELAGDGGPKRPPCARAAVAPASAAPPRRSLIPLGALVVSLLLFGAFVALAGVNPLDVYRYMVLGSVGSWFSFQNTLTRAAPLILTALCTALPAQTGLMIIGGEGAFVVGGLAAIAAGLPLAGFGVAGGRADRHGGCRHGRRRSVDRDGGRAAPLARRQRDDLNACS